MTRVLAAGVLLAVLSLAEPVPAQITGTCCDKQVELSKKGAGLIRSRPGCFDCKELLESGAKTFEEYVCKKLSGRGPMGRVTFATECGVVVQCPAAAEPGAADVRDSVRKQLREAGVGCAACPLLGASGTCPVQTELARLIAEAEARLQRIEQEHLAAAQATSSCRSLAEVLYDVCVKARTTPEEIARDCVPVDRKCAPEQARQNRLNWQRMVLQGHLRELQKLDFTCLEAGGRCPEISLTTLYEQFPRINENLCERGTRAEYVLITNKHTGDPIGTVFVKCS